MRYLTVAGKSSDLWKAFEAASRALPHFWASLEHARGVPAAEVQQAAVLAMEARAKGITHLHAHFATSAASVARLAAHFANIPYTLTAHAKDIFHENVDPIELAQKLRDASTVVTVSDHNVLYLQRAVGPAATRIRRIYNGIDLADFPFAAPKQRAARIVSVGRLVEKKGLPDLIEAVALLVQDGLDVRLDIVGSGPMEAAVRAGIQTLGLEERVRLWGPLPKSEVQRLVQEAAAFAAPCIVAGDNDRDGLPTVLLEAMALGTPCVSTPVTGIPEAVRDGETGLLVPQRDPRALADALARLLRDGDLRVRLARAARECVERDFDAHKNGGLLRSLFASGPVPIVSAEARTR